MHFTSQFIRSLQKPRPQTQPLLAATLVISLLAPGLTAHAQSLRSVSPAERRALFLRGGTGPVNVGGNGRPGSGGGAFAPVTPPNGPRVGGRGFNRAGGESSRRAAEEHRQNMPRATQLGPLPVDTDDPLAKQTTAFLPGVPVAPGPVTGGKWQFIGPLNLPSPAQVYYGPLNSFVIGRVNGVAYDPQIAGTLYVASPGGGIWRSPDYGSTWAPLTDSKFAHLQTQSVAVGLVPVAGAPAQKVMLAGMGDYDNLEGYGYSSGIMRSTDNGVTWTTATPVTPNTFGLQSFTSIVFDPDNPNIVVATSGGYYEAVAPPAPGTGSIWRSTDGGITWNASATPVSSAPDVPILDWTSVSIGAKPATGPRPYYATAPGFGVWKSVNQGASWTKLPIPLVLNSRRQTGTYNYFFGFGLEVAASKIDPNTVYAIDLSADFRDGRVFKSTTGGTTWVDITGNYPNGIGYNALGTLDTVPGYNFTLASYDLHITTSAFTVGSTLQDILYTGARTLTANIGGTSFHEDIGRTYQAAPLPQTHGDQHTMAIDPFDPYRSVYGNDGGIYGLTYDRRQDEFSTLAGLTLNRNLGIAQVYAADWSSRDATLMLGGIARNGSAAAQGDLLNWKNVGIGDGGGCAINTANSNIQYISGNDPTSGNNSLRVYRTTNNWASGRIDFTPTVLVNNVPVPWGGDPTPYIGVMGLSQTSPNFLFVGTNGLWMWNETTQTWTPRIGQQVFAGAGQAVSAIAVAPNDPNVVYVGTTDNRVWMTRNATALDAMGVSVAKWVRIDTPAGQGININPISPITSISVETANPYDILVAIGSPFNNPTAAFPRLWRCTNTFYPNPALPPATPLITFSNQSGNAGFTSLPNTPINDVTRDPNDPENTFYVATDIGVFTTPNNGATWADATSSLGLPNVQVNSIKAVAGTGFLNVATFGRGFWRIPLNDPGPTNFTATTGLTRNGNTITVTALLANNGRVAEFTRVTNASLTVGSTTTQTSSPLPYVLNTMGTGNTRTLTFAFPASVGRSGTQATFTFQGTYAGGTFTVGPIRTRLP